MNHERGSGRSWTWVLVASATGALLWTASHALAQGAKPGGASSAGPGSGGAAGVSIWTLFRQSFDLFTILILSGSIASLAIIVRSIIVVRRQVILPAGSSLTVRTLVGERRWSDLQKFAADDLGFLGRVLHEALPKMKAAGTAGGAAAVREATEVAADNETAKRFKEVELLGVLGNLGPLLGLVGTVWGMIIAFTAIGETGGQAAAAQLSIGIAKALFHTFLGLTLAVPSLLAYGIFRERLDRLCTEGAMLATDTMDAISASLLSGAPPMQPASSPPGAGQPARNPAGVSAA